MKRLVQLLVSLALVGGCSAVLSAQGTAIIAGGTLPTTCRPSVSGTPSHIFVKSGTGAGLYWCDSTNHWTGPLATGGLTSIANNRIIANISGSSAIPIENTLSAILDSVVGSTQHSLLIRSGSGWVATVLTNCGDTAGQHLNYRTGTFDFICGTSGAFGTISNNNVVSNISGSTATPVGNSLSAVLDSALSSTRGSVIYRGASGWSALTPGTSGQFFKTLGAGADPLWATPGGGGNVTGPGSSTTNHVAIFGDTSGTLIADGGNLPTYTPGGSDELVYHQVADGNFHGLVRDTSLTLTSGTLGVRLQPIYLIVGGGSQAGTGFSGMSYASSSATGVSIAGSNKIGGATQFTTTGHAAQTSIVLPFDLVGTTVDIYGIYESTAVTGNAVWKIETSCTGDGVVDDVAWTTSATNTDANKGTAHQVNLFTSSAITMQSSPACAANNIFNAKITLDTGSQTGTYNLLYLWIVPRRGY